MHWEFLLDGFWEDFAVLIILVFLQCFKFGLYMYAHAHITLRTIDLYAQLWHSGNKTESMQKKLFQVLFDKLIAIVMKTHDI